MPLQAITMYYALCPHIQFNLLLVNIKPVVKFKIRVTPTMLYSIIYVSVLLLSCYMFRCCVSPSSGMLHQIFIITTAMNSLQSTQQEIFKIFFAVCFNESLV